MREDARVRAARFAIEPDRTSSEAGFQGLRHIDAGEAVKVTVGTGAVTTPTVADEVAVPPAPVHAREYVVVAMGETDCVPLTALLPLHPPEAVHDVALVDDHVSVEDWPAVIDAGEAEMVTVGAGAGVTDTVADWDALPPAPVQVSV